MYVHELTRPHWDVLKWLALFAIAGALALLLAGAGMSTETIRPPELLPPDLLASPMPPDEGLLTPDSFSTSSEIWEAIELQKAGRIEEARSVWEAMRLPSETDHWRLLMLAVTHLQSGNGTRAAEVLEQARLAAPNNPVIHYTLGLLWLARAEKADEWYDAVAVDPFRLASTAPGDGTVPYTRSLCRLSAIMAFERATALREHANLDQLLVTVDWVLPDDSGVMTLTITPRVRDALQVFGGERFEGRSHLALGLLHMQHGALAHAEKHLDDAAEMGEPTGNAFRELGDQYYNDGLSGDAMRAHLKAFAHGGGAATFEQAIRDFWDSLSGE